MVVEDWWVRMGGFVVGFAGLYYLCPHIFNYDDDEETDIDRAGGAGGCAACQCGAQRE